MKEKWDRFFTITLPLAVGFSVQVGEMGIAAFAFCVWLYFLKSN